jgi:hypothetical protein
MSNEFSILEGKARRQIDEIMNLNDGRMNVPVGDTYWDYEVNFTSENSFSIALLNGGRKATKEDPRRSLDQAYDYQNIEKIAKSVGVPGECWDFDFDQVDGNVYLVIGEFEYEEYPGNEPFSHDINKVRERVEKIDEYLKQTENAGNRIANELSRPEAYD